jgi:hypothetical protein
MALTESRPVPPGGVEPPGGETARTRRHPWRWVLLGASALLTTAVIVLAVLAGTYQPVGFGNSWGGSFPGLPDGTRPVKRPAHHEGSDQNTIKVATRTPHYLRPAHHEHHGSGSAYGPSMAP